MTKERIEAAKSNLAQSAFEFLVNSVRELEERPKSSVIHFATAIELMLKARLMNEHWSLVVERISDATMENFLAGKCVTVSSNEAIKRLQRVCGETLPDRAVAQFRALSDHRNRMIHFFHEVGSDPRVTAAIAREQFLCWFYMQKLLSQWGDQFGEFLPRITLAGIQMRRNSAYLSAVFDALEPDLVKERAEGALIARCSACHFEAARTVRLTSMLSDRQCRVCTLHEVCIELSCPTECGHILQMLALDGNEQFCGGCGYKVTSHDLADALATGFAEPYEEGLINCALCLSPASVVPDHDRYVCTECLGIDDAVAACQWCNELQMGGGTLKNSYYVGCEFCHGLAGNQKDD